MRLFLSTLVITSLAAVMFSANVFAQTPPSFDSSHANAYFKEALAVADKEGGKLWGHKLYGPIFFIDYQNRAIIANQQDAKGVLHRNGDVFEGKLTEDIAPANTSVEWSGTNWTMMIWQTLPEDRLIREKMFAHEMFHRIQSALKLAPQDKLNLHLDSLEGRLWMQLEWRALAVALINHGSVQDQAVKDALAFRSLRQKQFPDSPENERSLEIAEGVPEYTGLVAAAPDVAAARWAAVSKLTNPDLTISLVRSFAYTSGPAYGLLLDQRLPGWRSKLTAQSDLGKLLSATVKGPKAEAKTRSSVYGASAIRTAENDRAEKIETTKNHYRKLLIDGPTLMFPGSDDMRFTFNPSTLISLDGHGAVYPTFHVTGPWGILEVTDGALRPKDLNQVIVAAPANTKGSHIAGQGWKLELLAGWRVVPLEDSKNFTVRKL
jgi:hypothetical protein